MRTLKFASLIAITILVLVTTDEVSSEKILVLTFFGSKSHKNVFEDLYQELARKGHQLTIVSPVKSGYSNKNMKEINGVTTDDIVQMDKSMPPLNVFNLRMSNIKIRTPMNPMVIPMLEKACRSYYEMPEVKALQKQKFALVIVSSFMNECTYGLVYKLNTSYITVHPHAMEHYKSQFTGFRMPSSFVPSYAAGGTDKMTFFERVLNFMAYNVLTFIYEWMYLPRMEAVYKEYLGSDLPSVKEIEKNISLALNNAHFSLTYPRPLMPQLIDVAGMHCRPGQTLPKDLKDFLDSSGSDGFILFSLGSHVKASDMPEKTRQEIVTAFSKMKQKILWKWDNETMEGLPKNVKLSTWVPQQDVLAHRNIRAFITHGGMLSTEESVYHGVPLIGIPLFGDQDWNMKQAEDHGYAITLELNDLTSDKLLEGVNRILTEKKYLERVKLMSKEFQDRSEKPLDTAVFWTEYVMRHKGAVHLRSPATELNDFAYYSIDVISFISFVLFLISYVIFSMIRICFWRKGKTPAGNKVKVSSSKKRQ